jgi:pimeloyl-ACP methyl ester carboxylesterase
MREIPASESTWNGFKKLDFKLFGRDCVVVEPLKPHPERLWIWRARFWGVEPQTEIALLKKGFHLVHIDISDLFGSPKAVSLWDRFYQFVIAKYELNPKAVLEGFSRGGLIVYNWASENADKIFCIYADAPVCDIKSWPAGLGKGEGSPECLEKCLAVYGMSMDELKDYRKNPIDNLEPLAKAGIPLLHVCGDVDTVVPMSENTDVLIKRYRGLGGNAELIVKEGIGHHPHSLEDPTPIVDFILKQTACG